MMLICGPINGCRQQLFFGAAHTTLQHDQISSESALFQSFRFLSKIDLLLYRQVPAIIRVEAALERINGLIASEQDSNECLTRPDVDFGFDTEQ
jgi:hypothetical protein